MMFWLPKRIEIKSSANEILSLTENFYFPVNSKLFNFIIKFFQECDYNTMATRQEQEHLKMPAFYTDI